MSPDSSKRSNLIDVTYQSLYDTLLGHFEGTTPDQLVEILKPRTEQLKNFSEPFGKPSDTSKKKIDSGSVTLPDGIVLHIEDADKDFIHALSKRFDIDQVNALILLRSFFYNEGLPADVGGSDSSSMVEELVNAITPFYYSERLHVLRTLIPLLRAALAQQSIPILELAEAYVPKIIPDVFKFAESLMDEYSRKLRADVPEHAQEDPRQASLWAKQNAKEQLGIQELLFWVMWGHAPCTGPLVVKIFETAYQAHLGSQQQNSTLLLDEESLQIIQDCAAMWILILVEVLELERAGEVNAIELSSNAKETELYWVSPEHLTRIHEAVISQSNSNFVCVHMAWTIQLNRLVKAAQDVKELPTAYGDFFQTVVSSTQSRTAWHAVERMRDIGLSNEAGLFRLLHTLLTTSPLFVTSAAWRTGSTVTDPNAVAYRSVTKGFLIALVELVPVEMIADFDGLLEVWIALFGRSEPHAVVGICDQFWAVDWHVGIFRRSIVDVTRSRFPVQPRPFLRLLRSLTGTGFLDTDPLSPAVDFTHGDEVPFRDVCMRAVLSYINDLPTFTQVVHINQCTGAHALYEKLPERFGSSSATTGPSYMSLRPIRLPGGSILPVKSVGRLLSNDGGDFIVVAWQHQHSGWKLVLELLTDYVNRRRTLSSSGASYEDISFGARNPNQYLALKLEEIGVEMDRSGDEDIIIDCLDLIRSVIQGCPDLAQELLQSMESGDPVVSHTMTEAQPPDLVQLTTMILEEGLSRSVGQHHVAPRTQLITSAMSVLTALLAVPSHSNRVWLYIRSTASLFGTDRASGVASSVLAAERLTGHYTMTIAILRFVDALFAEASSTVLLVTGQTPKLHQIKEEVLMRATRFVHSEIWVEHLGWKYAQLSDRFEIGRRVTTLYMQIFKHASPALKDTPFAKLSNAVADALLFKATTSTVSPLVTPLVTGGSVFNSLYNARRHGDARRLVYLLESHLSLTRVLLTYKQKSPAATNVCLLEQALCSRAGHSSSFEGGSSKAGPIDALAGYVKERGMGSIVPVTATQVLFALCSSLSTAETSTSTIIGHLSDPEATVSSMVRIVQHPYDDALLRSAVWNFITLAVDKEPALARLFVTGQLRMPSAKGKEKADDPSSPSKVSALNVACDMLEEWRELWEPNPKLLASLLRFLDVVWQHAHEHKAVLDPIRKSSKFFEHLGGIIAEELGPSPDCATDSYVVTDGVTHSDHHEAISGYSYRSAVKAHAAHILAADIQMHTQSPDSKDKPPSYNAISATLKSEDQITELIPEAAASSYRPEFHDEFSVLLKNHYPTLSLDHLQVQVPIAEREYGDDFAFSISLARFRLQVYAADDEVQMEEAIRYMHNINLNLSLAHVQTALAEAWHVLLLQVAPYLRGDAAVRPHLLGLADALSRDLATEQRSGEMMSTIHAARLSLVLSLLEVVWFSTSEKKEEVETFIALVKNVRGIITNPAQSPTKSVYGQMPVPFHRPLLQILYFCARHARSIAHRPKVLNAEQRLAIAALLEATLIFVVDALRITFDRARLTLDLDIDLDMELLVAVFEQSTRLDLNPSPSLWLTQCQETDVVRASLELFGHMDVVGLSDVALLRARKQPLYTPHVLTFHMAMASITSAAERLASEGLLVAYLENAVSRAIRQGRIDVVIPELPGEQSPAHRTYCSMLAIVAGVTTALGKHGQYFESEVCGLLQFYNEQIHRALSWTIDDPLTLPLLEEIEQVVNVYAAIARGSAASSNDAVKRVLQSFTTDALLLIQQLNYALTHPNHLASVFEPITSDERTRFEQDRAGSSTNTPVDPMRRPFLTRLIHRLYRLSSTILSALIDISGAETVLLGEPEDWHVSQALIVPHSKVVLGEPASLGTLLELGNASLDILRLLVDRPPAQALTPGTSEDKALDVWDTVVVVRRNLEAALLYAVTQLAMWLSKPEFDAPPNDAEGDDMMVDGQAADALSLKERRVRKVSMTMAERLRRGMKGEMAGDLQSLLGKAKPLIAKSSTVLGVKDVDLMQVLLYFVQERISIPG